MTQRDLLEVTHHPARVMITNQMEYGKGMLVMFTKTYPADSMTPGKREVRTAFYCTGVILWDVICG